MVLLDIKLELEEASIRFGTHQTVMWLRDLRKLLPEDPLPLGYRI